VNKQPYPFALATLPAALVANALALSIATLSASGQNAPPSPIPIDPQKVQDQQDMTWADYKPIPDINWQDPSKKATVRALKVALIAIDFPDQPFVITKPKKSDPFGNPQIDPIKREDVAKFYADFWHKPSALNHGQTINGYWMEQSRGKYGIAQVDAFGPYQMPRPLWSYGLAEFGQQNYTPDGNVARGGMERDCDSLWRAEPGADVAARNMVRNGGQYDQIIRIYAGYDETGVWQEFGEMKFETRDDIPPEWGNPNPEKPRWVPTRYEPWTSWLAGSQQWGQATIRQGENSGTIMHELGHSFFSTGDNNNNPYAEPYRRVGSGPWDMMDRGSFNGPGGPHNRWEVPVMAGGAMPAGLMLRQKINFGFLSPEGTRSGRRGGPTATAQAANIHNVLFLSREGLAKSGLAVGTVVARAVEPGPGQLAGILVQFDGAPVPLANGGGRAGRGGGINALATTTQDRTPWVDPATDPLSPGIPSFSNYTLEVVQRIGYDSFCPDSGVLIAKNKDIESFNGGPNGYNCFNWVIDAHPEDIHMVDFKRPKSGTPVMRTVADFRQLNDALFHAGTNSGSLCEYEDTPNRLHFYIIDVHHDAKGILSYTLGVRSLDGSGPQTRDVALAAGPAVTVTQPNTECAFTLSNTGKSATTDPALHPSDATSALNSEIYRLSVTSADAGWSAQLANIFVAVPFGETVKVPVYATHAASGGNAATITLKATCESDPAKSATATLHVAAP
jgi:M6 family metalloprotease-like protein